MTEPTIEVNPSKRSFLVRRGNMMFKVFIDEHMGTTVAKFVGIKTGNDRRLKATSTLMNKFIGGTEKTVLHSEDKYDVKEGVKRAVRRCFFAVKSKVMNLVATQTRSLSNFLGNHTVLIQNNGTFPKGMKLPVKKVKK